MNRLGASICAVILVCWLPSAQATSVEEPLDLIRGATEDLLVTLEEAPDVRTSPEELDQLVKAVVLPHLDLQTLSRLTLGKYWRRATSDQRERFMSQFRTLLIRTYSSSLAEYSNQGVEYRLLKISKDGLRAAVRTRILQSGKAPVTVDYSLRRTNTDWKIYDVAIQGISLVVNYRATFSAEIRHRGLDALIETLATQNAESRTVEVRAS